MCLKYSGEKKSLKNILRRKTGIKVMKKDSEEDSSKDIIQSELKEDRGRRGERVMGRW